MIFITFKDGSFQDVNQAAVDLLGYGSKQELLSLGSAEKVYDNVMHWEVFQRQIDRDGFVKDFEANSTTTGNASAGQIKPQLMDLLLGYQDDGAVRSQLVRNLVLL